MFNRDFLTKKPFSRVIPGCANRIITEGMVRVHKFRLVKVGYQKGRRAGVVAEELSR